MIDSFWLKAVLKAVLLPPTGLLLLVVVGLCVAPRFSRAGRALAWAGVTLLWLLSLPVVATMLQRSLYDRPAFDIADAAGAQAIVILGGGVRRHAPEYGGDTVSRLTLERVRYGAIVARLTHLPVLVTGGAALGGDVEAKLMKEVLEREYGVDVRWVEARSRNTHENALRSAEILRAASVTRVVLVAHSFDMPRAISEFAAAGIVALPAATSIPSDEGLSLLDYLPSVSGLQGSYYALYEIAANLVRWTSLRAGG